MKNQLVDMGLTDVFVRGEAFTLREDFLKTFTQQDLIPERKIFNCRFSRARGMVENVSEIMAKCKI
jgi:hypothetical protein